MCVSSLVVDEIKRIVKSSEIMKEDDAKWPQKNKDGRQELEIKIGGEHINFEVGARNSVSLHGCGQVVLTSDGKDCQDWFARRRYGIC